MVVAIGHVELLLRSVEISEWTLVELQAPEVGSLLVEFCYFVVLGCLVEV